MNYVLRGSIHADPKRIPPNPEVPSQEQRPPNNSEIEYARFAAKTPHVVLSTKLESVSWPAAQIVRNLDELRLIVHPIVLGSGKPLFKVAKHHSLKFVDAKTGKSGSVILTYRV